MRASLKSFVARHPYTSRIILIISIIALYLRLEPGLFGLTHFSFDQTVDFILAKHLVIDQKLSLIGRYTGLEGVFMGPYYTWFLAIPYLLSAGDPNFIQIFFGLTSFVFLFITFYLFIKHSHPSIAFMIFFLASFSQSFLSASHNLLSPSPLTYLAPIYFFVLYRIINQPHSRLLPALALLISIFFQFEIAAAIFLIPLTFIVLLLYRRQVLPIQPSPSFPCLLFCFHLLLKLSLTFATNTLSPATSCHIFKAKTKVSALLSQASPA